MNSANSTDGDGGDVLESAPTLIVQPEVNSTDDPSGPGLTYIPPVIVEPVSNSTDNSTSAGNEYGVVAAESQDDWIAFLIFLKVLAALSMIASVFILRDIYIRKRQKQGISLTVACVLTLSIGDFFSTFFVQFMSTWVSADGGEEGVATEFSRETQRMPIIVRWSRRVCPCLSRRGRMRRARCKGSWATSSTHCLPSPTRVWPWPTASLSGGVGRMAAVTLGSGAGRYSQGHPRASLWYLR